MEDHRAGPPRPEDATTAAEFITAMKQLRLWSGLTYRQLEGKARAAGDVLPSSTTATMLGRATLPREQLVSAYARACGLDEDDTRRWVEARRRLAMEPAEPVAVEPADPPARGRAWWPLVAGVAVLVAVAATVTALVIRPGSLEDPPDNGWYRLHPAHVAELCVGEGRERNQRTDRPLAVQRSCEGLVPDTYLEAVGEGVYLVKWRHPAEGWGCLAVDGAHLGDEALIAPDDCTGAAHQRFLLEPVSMPVPRGFLLRPVHSGKCVGLLGGPAEVSPGAELTQTSCTGQADQEFIVESVPPPDQSGDNASR
ncbi:XRE family transcriptional regulator [Saccharothrix obliqua]|uniref:XRE family transcriptional regulator n=1 Tax=Saccharothrix obliqua TaxID=2861747 RepID=UPI001C5D8A3C|nr:XRE family transcriptional regulator [Saccharothrix obliqua]MBW4721309.1 XRE family transcriptional regulator [Saccharothrix obliqua]